MERLAATVAARGEARIRVLLDGALTAEVAALAADVSDALRVRGRAAVPLAAEDFLRPASVRLEHGRHDPDARLEDWLDTDGLVREVLAPWGPGGSGRYLPSLWDPVRDRATRAPYVDAPPRGALLVHGSLLLGRDLPAELAVHLEVSAAALARRVPEGRRWELPAYARYAAEVGPSERADVVVRLDDPRRPAWVERDPER